MKHFFTISLCFLALSLSVFGQGACNNQTSITHQGYEYDIVEIGYQCWFAENCRYLPSVSPYQEYSETDHYYYVYDYQGTDVEAAKSTANYETYGVLYNWPAVMTEGVCPSDWHIPSDGEWMELEMSLGMSASEANGEGWRGYDEGYQMKSTSGWNDYQGNNGNGSNSSGFKALPGGFRSYGGFLSDGDYGHWWSSSESDSFSWTRELDYSIGGVYRGNYSRYFGFSARCVQNALLSGCTDIGACNYDSIPIIDDGSCEYLTCAGCTTTVACNYDPEATIDDGSCEFICEGCTDEVACNYDPSANVEDSSCEYLSCTGCTDAAACNFNPESTINDGSCFYPEQYYDCDGNCINDSDGDGICDEFEIPGCTDQGSCNYDTQATDDDGSCEYETCAGCQYEFACNYDPEATIADNESCEYGTCPGCIDLTACNYNPTVSEDDGSCEYCSCIDVWQQVGEDIDGEAATDLSGSSVSLSSDGTTVAIGALWNDGNGEAGHVRIYTRVGDTWQQVGEDIDGEAGGDQSGYSVSLSSDGTTVAIGARYNDGNGSSSGHVRIYTRVGDTWQQVGWDIDGEAASDQSGYSVSLSSDGTTVAIGAPYNDGNGFSSGHVRIYTRFGNTWQQVGEDIDGDHSGNSVSLSSDGTIVAIGARYNNGNGYWAGHVRIRSINTCSSCTDPTACNYSENAFEDDGSCIYLEEGYTCDGICINDANGDGICDSFCQEDLNGDGVIGVVDLLLVLSEFGCSSLCENDIDQDGYVAVQDILQLLSEFGNTCDIEYTDECGVLNGDNSTCADCCGVPNGDGSSCDGSCGACNDNYLCLDQCGVPNGDNSTCADFCGVPNGDNSTCFMDCGDDIMHEGHDYSTVQIGEQCWFSENCRYLPEVSSPATLSYTEPKYYVYDYLGTDVSAAQSTYNYPLYGVLYNWPAVMTEGICPSGWHIPSDEEFIELINYVGGEDVAGDRLKYTSGWLSNFPYGNGSNSSGFSGRAGGYNNSGGFSFQEYYGLWRSTSEDSGCLWLAFDFDGALIFQEPTYNGYSARCLQD